MAQALKKAWDIYLEDYIGFLVGFLFAGVLIVGYQAYVQHGTVLGQLFAGMLCFLIVFPLVATNMKSNRCRDCNGRMLEPGSACGGKDITDDKLVDWRVVENGGKF